MRPEITLRCSFCHERAVEDAVELWGSREDGREAGWCVPFGCLSCLRRESWRSAGRLFLALQWVSAIRVASTALVLPWLSPTVWLADALAAVGVTTKEFQARQTGQLHAWSAAERQDVVRLSNRLAVLLRGLAQADGETSADEWQAVRRVLYLQHLRDEEVWKWVDPGRERLSAPSEEAMRSAAQELRAILRPYDAPLLLSLFAQVAHDSNGLLESEQRMIHQLCDWLGIAEKEVETFFGKKPSERSAYEILAVAETASWGEIRKTYLKLAMENHPDRVARLGPAMVEAATERMKAINEAYRQLRAKRSA